MSTHGCSSITRGIDRRDALKGLTLGAGSVLLSPMLARMQAEAAGLPVRNKRFVFVVESNGVRPEQVAPVGIQRKPREQRPLNGPAEMIDVSLDDHDLPFSLEPIAPWKDRVTIVEGLSG
ncbi:MAG: twin-arginine translocation signal domain-containing protein, partial [Planctomycetales bacterium]|nr:twin-arginine translocation signal domain-containing protein [Planctomycetales bacterium]